MKIIWAIPVKNNPETGAEKIYVNLKNYFVSKLDNVFLDTLDFSHLNKLLNQIIKNLNNFKVLFEFDKTDLIFEDLLYRRNFMIANIFLSLFFKRKIIVFVNEEFSELDKVSLRVRYLLKIYYNFFFRSMHKIIVNSKATAGWVNGFGNFKDKIIVFYPVIKKQISEDVVKRQRLSKDKKEHKLLCVANIRKNKGQEYLIDGLSFLNRDDVKIEFAGTIKEQDYYDYLQKKIKENKLQDRIAFRGFLKGKELEEIYKNSDIFVLPTLKEGFGMVLLEAMSFGVPIIASRVGGIPELIKDEIDGLLVLPASAKELACVIQKLIENDKLKKELIENGFKRYLSLESFDYYCNILYKNLGLWQNL